MKTYIILLLTLSVMITACSSDSDAPSAEETLLKQLSGTWHATTVTKDDSEENGYANFKLILSGSAGSKVQGYSVSGRPQLSPWPAGGTWSLGTSANSIVRDPGTDDELIMTYEVTDTQLTLEFTSTGIGYDASRVATTEGDWVFVFSK